MLEGLDLIDWKSTGNHIYGNNEAIPVKIRNLLSEDAIVYEDAISFLLGSGQDFVGVYNTTSHILPFLFELLNDKGTPNKANILSHISGKAEFIFRPGYMSVRQMRLCINTYETLKAGVPTLTRLFASGLKEERLACTEVLRFMTDEVEYLIPLLIDCFQKEPDEDIQVALLESLQVLLSSLEWPREDLKDKYSPFIAEIITTTTQPKIRLAAAQAAVETARSIGQQNTDLLEQAAKVLVNEIQELIQISDKNVDQARYKIEALVKELSKLSNPKPFVELLQDPKLNPEQIHLFVRGLMASRCIYRGLIESHWEKIPEYDPDHAKFYYAYYLDIQPYLYESIKNVLEVIVMNDRVWEVPTNLLSFFYGLPDSRQELKAILDMIA